jgi:arginase
MSIIGKRGIHYLQKLKTANISPELLEKGQNRVIDASLTLIRERAKLKVYSS